MIIGLGLRAEKYNTLDDLENITRRVIPKFTNEESIEFGCRINNAHIVELALNDTNLEDLPKSIGNLKYLKKLDLSGNKFKSVPFNIWPLKNLKEINMERNPLEKDSRELKKNSIPIILEYCQNNASIQLFASHDMNDFEPYKIAQFIKFLENQEKIYKVVHFERDLAGSIKNFMRYQIKTYLPNHK